MTSGLQVGDVAQALSGYGLDLQARAGAGGGDRGVTTADLHRPGLALVGHFFHHHPERIHVFGETEITFLAQRRPDERRDVLLRLADEGVPAFVVTKDQAPGDDFVALCDQRHVPLYVTPLDTGEFIRSATRILAELLAPTTVIHGVMVDVLGVGILISGTSGIGKSECALELVLRGHRLVADDMVEVRLLPPGTLVARSMELIKHHMEIRGLGIINVQDLFGAAAVRDEKRLELVVELEPWDPEAYYDRLGTEEKRTRDILGHDVEVLHVPVRPGRNLSEVIEVAARNRILKIRGVDSARRFQERLMQEIAGVSAPAADDDEAPPLTPTGGAAE